MNDPTIQKGRALVLAGPQGCGKTKLARELAAAHGTFVETDERALRNPFRLGNLLARNPATIIVDEVPAALIAAAETRQLVASERIVMHLKMREEQEVPSPNFIFCTSDTEPLKHLDGRWFRVVRIQTT